MEVPKKVIQKVLELLIIPDNNPKIKSENKYNFSFKQILTLKIIIKKAKLNIDITELATPESSSNPGGLIASIEVKLPEASI